MEVTLRVGKSGLERIVEEAKDQLEARKKIKVRVNQPMVEGRMGEFTGKMANKLAGETGARVVRVRGRTFILEAE